jgi:uncharacterized DUF497 family protein
MEFRYNIEKNALLLASRGIGFEEIITAINNGNLITITAHHNLKKYPGQKIMHVRCLDKVYLVPYVIEQDGAIFLKTLFPSRKATKLFSKEK